MTLIKNFIAEISQMKTLWKYIHAKSIEKRFKELCKDFDNCIDAMNNIMEKFMNKTTQDQKKIDNIFQVHRLRLSDYEKTDEKQRGRVTKRVNLRNKSEEFAFQISEEECTKIKLQFLKNFTIFN